jgi:hypothetical protein
MRRPAINEFQACRLQTTKPVTILDLTTPAAAATITQEQYRYFMTWPLIACCSVKVKNGEDTFKPEYIMPQLLLQWIRKKQEIDGVRYNSTHIDLNLTKSKGDFSNYVFPVKDNVESGHCTVLKKLFRMTEPLSWQLYEYALGGQLFLHGEHPVKKVERLELITGRSFPYHYSTLGKLEAYLDGMNLHKLD